MSKFRPVMVWTALILLSSSFLACGPHNEAPVTVPPSPDDDQSQDITVGKALLMQTLFLRWRYEVPEFSLGENEIFEPPRKVSGAWVLENYDFESFRSEHKDWLMEVLRAGDRVDAVTVQIVLEGESRQNTMLHFRDGIELPDSLSDRAGYILPDLDWGVNGEPEPGEWGYIPNSDGKRCCWQTQCDPCKPCFSQCPTSELPLEDLVETHDLLPYPEFVDPTPLSGVTTDTALIDSLIERP